MVDLNELELSNELLDIGDVQNWTEPSAFAPPPPAGNYRAVIDSVVDARTFEARGKPQLEVVLNYRVLGGEYDGRAVTFQRVNTFVNDDRSSLLDFFKSAGVPDEDLINLSVKDAAKLVYRLAEQAATVSFYLDWSAYSVPARDFTLRLLTGADTTEEAKAKAEGNNDIWNEAKKAALVCRGYRNFPSDAKGGKKPIITCPITSKKVEARAYVARYTEGE